jgi:acyl-CoA thioester hydrolase
VPVHFDDLDAMGLLHNARYALLVERAMISFWTAQGWSFDLAKSRFRDGFLVVGEFKVAYKAPIVGVGSPLVTIWIEHLGTTSAKYGFRITSADRSILHAEGHRVNVNIDPVTFRPVPFSAELRAAAAQLELTTGPIGPRIGTGS